MNTSPLSASPPVQTEVDVRPVVAVFNSADDVIEVLRVALEGAGFAVVTAKLSEIQSGVMDLLAFALEHRPAAIVYDIPRPYEANWNFLRLLRETDSLKRLGWVLTTLNKSALEAVVGPATVVEIVLGTPYSLDDVVSAVRDACLAKGTRHSRSPPPMNLDSDVRLDGVRILVVDDDADTRHITRLTLERQGGIVTEAEAGRQAFDLLQQERPDVLLTDLSMPGEDGYWLIAAVRALSVAHGGGTPAAAMTGHVTAEDRASVLRAGFQFHIAKPADAARLVGIIAILALKA